MANVDFFSAFGYAWGENGAIDQWVDTQYKLGWASIGSVPPSVEQFNRVHQIADQKANWLYGQLKAAATANGVTLAAGDLSALVQILAATAPDASSTKKGLIEIATATEAKALTSTLLAITPATLAAVLADFRSGIPGATFAEVDALTEDQGPIIVTDHGGAVYVWGGTKYDPLIASETYAGSLKIATAALAQALTDDAVALTPKKLADAFKGGNQLLAAAGFQKIPGGLILQFGQADGGASSSGTITFPTAFPNECLICLATDNAAIGTPALAVGTSFTATNFTWQQASGSTIAAFNWFAIGR
ncbi:MAG TPA: hypothetical protein VNS29_04325 [Burkholderiaceae bacterium]|nr:hypothetical protein [Burkholderiaceae bacterium]